MEQYVTIEQAKMSTAVQIETWNHRRNIKQVEILFNIRTMVGPSCFPIPPPPQTPESSGRMQEHCSSARQVQHCNLTLTRDGESYPIGMPNVHQIS